MINILKQAAKILVGAISCVLLFSFCSMASEDVEVLINNTKAVDKFDREFDIMLDVQFKKFEAYNPQVNLSYHIYNDDTGELVQFENDRLPLVIDTEGLSTNSLHLDLRSYGKIKNLRVVFDLIDEKNDFWFSEKQDMNFRAYSIVLCNDKWLKLQNALKTELSEAPIIFAVNICVCLSLIVLVTIVIRRKIIEW